MNLTIRRATTADEVTLIAFNIAIAWETERKHLDPVVLASGVGAVVDSGQIEWSPPLVVMIRQQPELFSTILSAGDDYEILATVPAQQVAAFEVKAMSAPTPMHRIGTIVEGVGVRVTRIDGTDIVFDRKGWDHF